MTSHSRAAADKNYKKQKVTINWNDMINKDLIQIDQCCILKLLNIVLASL